MVANPRKAPGTGGIRSLKSPRLIRVQTDRRGRPLGIRTGRIWTRVVEVGDRWRLDDEWWREKLVSRLYYRVLLENGRRVTIFQDIISRHWHEQSYD